MAVHGSPSSESVSKWARRLLRAVQALLLPTLLQYHSSTGSKPLRRTAHDPSAARNCAYVIPVGRQNPCIQPS
ncbi:hypothetical protein N7537_001840 [Penicillium hordei]|uniref:Uncharacterized protein n=1 Tax=Penicillium hordei TaxID=40994 RepID=A0AAD6H6C6_9EURO|nr:uncharacterized protein N7537_001840 [Penicillium hordei]KAJ5616726.1 hypothetical protein N7537_001840 [Penicillium hordei]